MRHKVAAAPLRVAFFLTQHLVAPPPAGLHYPLHLVPPPAVFYDREKNVDMWITILYRWDNEK
jgi:hypothetical protein